MNSFERIRDMLSDDPKSGLRNDHERLALEIINLQDRQTALVTALGMKYEGSALKIMVDTTARSTATGEQMAKLNAPAAGHVAPDDVEVAELYTQVHELSRQLKAQTDEVRKVTEQ